ncbi:hypothetical protein SAMN05519103_05235 [Rhizobiales bacterium GAS113]|nr:hypothetical protein SAMN05519103_05235 [Rhizobiales bacterium GAS113]
MRLREKRRLSFRESFVLGLIFLVIGFGLFLAEAGYGALRDRLTASRGRRVACPLREGIGPAR